MITKKPTTLRQQWTRNVMALIIVLFLFYAGFIYILINTVVNESISLSLKLLSGMAFREFSEIDPEGLLQKEEKPYLDLIQDQLSYLRGNSKDIILGVSLITKNPSNHWVYLAGDHHEISINPGSRFLYADETMKKAAQTGEPQISKMTRDYLGRKAKVRIYLPLNSESSTPTLLVFELNANILIQVQIFFFLILAAVLAICLLVSFFIVKAISRGQTRSIEELLHTIKKTADIGNLAERIEVINFKADEQVGNEVGEAARSFNQMLEQIKHLKYEDSVTKLNNIYGFFLEFPYLLNQIFEHKMIAGIVIISVDDFNRINSINGYESGNEVLKQLAHQLSTFVHREEAVARYYGHEFVLLLKAETSEALEQRILRLRQHCSTVMTINEVEFILKTSIGINILNKNSFSYEDNLVKEEIFNRATLAKLFVKQQGGNGYQFYNDTMEELIKEEQYIEKALNYALERDEFYLVYQPIQDLTTGKVIGNEALLRWSHDEFGKVSIQTLIEIAEQNGKIVEIGKWVLREACRQNYKWQQQGFTDLIVAVNVSALQFEQPDFVEMVKQILMETQADPASLELEITERIAMIGVEEKIEKMKQLKVMGIRISIDDFGTGYSSLAYFTQFPIDTLKIDRSFINKMIKDANDSTIIDTIINMAHAMKVKTIAEGIETPEQLSQLNKKGCDRGQGYLFSKPSRAEVIDNLLVRVGCAIGNRQKKIEISKTISA